MRERVAEYIMFCLVARARFAQVTHLINDEANEGVEDVQLKWVGKAFSSAVGSYEIVAEVTLAGGVTTHCYATLIEISDTDECAPSSPKGASPAR